MCAEDKDNRCLIAVVSECRSAPVRAAVDIMGWFSSIANLGKKAVGSVSDLGKKAVGSVSSIGKKVGSLIPVGKKLVQDVVGGGIGETVADLAAGAAGKVLDSGVGKTITGGIMKGADFADSMTGGALGLKRKAEELESAVRSGKLAQQAVDFAQRKAARRLAGK